jgi:CRP-like cAMP-binding protein
MHECLPDFLCVVSHIKAYKKSFFNVFVIFVVKIKSIKTTRQEMHLPKLNFLLASLPEADYTRLASHLELVGLTSGTELFHTGKQRTDIYFPTTCTVSAQIELEEGNCTDVYLLGDRGLFGTGTLKRGTYFKAVVRKPGFAYRCPTSVYMEEMVRGEGVMMMSLMATRIIMEEMATNISCRTFHTLSQQVARWLINYGQGDPIEIINITHNDLANVLGVRRERVTLALNQLENHGCISLNRGHIKVNDYASLMKYACNCNTEPTLNKLWSEEELEGVKDLPAKLKKLTSLLRSSTEP